MKILQLLALLSIGLSCSQTQENFSTITSLPKKIKEASACEISKVSPLIWTIEDNHNHNILFGFNEKGELIKKITISNVENNDWEDLTSDDKGNIYIGDFGNNDNDRQNLAIYKINASDLNKDEAKAESIVQFYYPEQTEFPPKKKDRIFDVESFFIHNNKFYLFTKNRSSKFDGTTVLYEVDNNSAQKLPAKKIGSFVTCDQFNHCAVTSADISPNKDKVAILSSDKVWIFTNWKGNNFFSGNVEKIELNHHTQKEGLCFKDENTIMMTDEGDKKITGNLYQLKLK
ncbi:hypothetical protein [Epilithonimonas hungarica]|uniref:T9SS C-terminal target domain-containing protein n=1 Tax=Epilithonimonas hungarica TaxID=454006 RepID=A0A1G7J980_9FLAO|nr:hypothetical protein [Epilithonimonas hungarica]SDF21426.1 hypothetical protein SAMN05421825_1314 [Epilithonimonas hungarica]